MGVLSAEWQRSAIQTHQAHRRETPVQTQNIFPDGPDGQDAKYHMTPDASSADAIYLGRAISYAIQNYVPT